MSMKKYIGPFVAILLCQLNICAQSDFVTTGGDATGSSGSVAYTVGETFYINITGETGSISLGVQQPHFVIMIGVDETNDITASLFPNPTDSRIHLRLSEQLDISTRNIFYQLHDLAGKIVLKGEIESTLTEISMQELTDAVYVLRIYNSDKEIKSFKIFKSR